MLQRPRVKREGKVYPRSIHFRPAKLGDDARLRELATRITERRGYTVTVSALLREAVRWLLRERPEDL